MMMGTDAIRTALKKTPIRTAVHAWRSRRAIKTWHRDGCPAPPPAAYKQGRIKTLARQMGLKTFIETGTYTGDMVEVARSLFSSVHSIEIDAHLFADAKSRFANDKRVTIHNGDSGLLLPEILSRIYQGCLFWLDGHFSGFGTGRAALDTPIRQELLAILTHRCETHVILIDDARCFTGENGYPTLEELGALIRNYRPKWNWRIQHDVIEVGQSL